MNKKIRPSVSQLVEDGIYAGKIVGAFEKVFKSQYYPSGQRDVLSIRVAVYNSDEIRYLFYNVTWEWTNYRFCQLLEDMAVMPEPGEEFNPEKLVGKNVIISVENQTSQGRNFTNIVEMKPRKVSIAHGMASEPLEIQGQGGAR